MSSALSTTPGLVFWLPLDEAARRFDVDRDELIAAVRRGELDVRAKIVGGDVVASVCSTDLALRYGPPRDVPAAAPADEIEHDVRGRLVAAEDRARVLELDGARLAGQLSVAERLERGLQRYADRLEERGDREREAFEQRLAEAELVRLQLARVVGQLEAEVARLQAQIGAAESPPQIAAAVPRRSGGWRRWFGGGARASRSRARN
ncbi:MAG: hypothetical protein AAGA20_08790 [Planctomycetota bacterium]